MKKNNMTKEDWMKLVKYGVISPTKNAGGQHTGMIKLPVYGELKELGIRIELNVSRSSHSDRELIKTLIELILEDAVKHHYGYVI